MTDRDLYERQLIGAMQQRDAAAYYADD